MKLTALLSALLLMAAALPAAAQMNYQGRLTDPSGNPLGDGQYTLEFSLWDAATGGTAPANQVWGPYTLDGSAGKPKADLVSGRFNVIIGATDASNRQLRDSFSGARFLQIKVGTNSPITPRQQILAAPDAVHAQIADTVVNGAIGTAQLANLAVTGAKIADGTIPVSKLTGAGASFWDGNGTDVWRPAGNVGIGVLVPGAKLDVLGTTRLQGTTTIVNTDGVTGNLQIGIGGALGAKSINFGDSDFVRVGEDPAQDDTLILKGSTIKMIGEVKLGSTSQYSATGGEESLRIVRGRGNANNIPVGVAQPPWVGAGYTYKRISQGVVEVTFNTPFAGPPTVTANAILVAGVVINCVIEKPGTGAGGPEATGFTVITFDYSSNGRDWPFNFIAIGPR